MSVREVLSVALRIFSAGKQNAPQCSRSGTLEGYSGWRRWSYETRFLLNISGSLVLGVLAIMASIAYQPPPL